MEEGAVPSSAEDVLFLPPPPAEATKGPISSLPAASFSNGAPGGPLFMPGFVSGLTNARKFQGSCASLLVALQAELIDASIQADDSDLWVNDLKIHSDEELINRAMEKVIQEDKNLEDVGTCSNETMAALPAIDKQHWIGFCHEQSSIGSQDILSSSTSGCYELEERNKTREGSILYDSSSLFDGDGHACKALFASPQGNHCNGHFLPERETQCASEIQVHENGQSKDKTGSFDVCSGRTPIAMERIPGQNQLLQKRHAWKKTKRKGRPFDRNLRGADWGMDGTSHEEAYLTRLRMERENAKANADLNSLRAKMEQEGVPAPFENTKNMQALNFFVSPPKANVASIEQEQEVLPFEVILWIEVYHSRLPHRRRKAKSQEFLVLGSQKLTALRDKIYCLTDELMRRAQTYVPSGYFLFENVFYNDLRDARAIDYSIPIIEWVRKQQEAEQGKDIGDNTKKKKDGKMNKFNSLHSADMASTEFLDLQFRVGMQYIYCHQGDCKHAIVIRDMRLVHKEDVQNTINYPLLRTPFRVRHRKCNICRIYRAKKVTYADKLAPESPCFFCDCCYYMLHYSTNGTLLYNDFKVYDYYHE